MEDVGIVIITPDLDFAEIEKRVLAAEAMAGFGRVYIQIETGRDGAVEIPGREIIHNSVSAMLEEHANRIGKMVLAKEAARVRAPDYLRHDPTKRHTRKR